MQVRRMLYAFELGREVVADAGDEALRQVIAVQYRARVFRTYSREHEEMARDSGVTVCIGAAFLLAVRAGWRHPLVAHHAARQF